MTHIRIEREGAVGIITIDRKERFNSLDVETARDLRKAGLQLARDNEVRCVILRGVNGIFCSGADLKYIRTGGDQKDLAYLQPSVGQALSLPRVRQALSLPGQPERLSYRQPEPRQPERLSYGPVFKQILEYIHSTISEIRRASKPFIAAVDGVAAAGGLGLAICCDLVIASERSTFEFAYSKTGLTGAESSTFFLPRLVGLRRSLELLLLNPRLDARRAQEYGLVTRVLPDATFDADVLAMATQIANGPTEALGIAKQLMNEAAGVDRLDFHLDRELEHLARIADGAAFAEGLSAFFEKRSPHFPSPPPRGGEGAAGG